MKKCWLYVLLLGVSLNLLVPEVLAQPCIFPDSLQKKVETLPYSRRNFEKLLHIESNINKGQNSLECLEWMLQTQSLSDSALALAYNLKGKELRRLELYELAIQNYLVSDSIASLINYLSLQANNANALGVVNAMERDYVAAIEYLLKCKELVLEMKIPKRALMVDMNIALLLKRQGRFNEALDLFLDINEKIVSGEVEFRSNAILGTVEHNLGGIYQELDNYPKALEHYEKALAIKVNLKNPRSEVITRIDIFEVQSKLGKHDEALVSFERASKLVQKMQVKGLNIQLEKSWGKVMEHAGQFEEAIKHYEVGLGVAEETEDYGMQKEFHADISRVHELLENFEKALYHRKQMNAFADSLTSQQTQKLIRQAEARFNYKTQQAEITLLKKQQAFNQLTIAGTAALAIAILVALLALYSRFRTKSKSNEELLGRNREIQQQYVLLSQRNREISDKNILLNDQKTQLEDQNSIIAKRNKELRQANETLEQFSYVASHDLTQPLRTIRSFLGLMENNSPELTETSREYLRYAKVGTEKLVTLVRALLAYNRVGRQQAELDRVHLDDTLAQVHLHLASQFEQSRGTLEVDALPTIEGISAEIYLVFQNLVSNALKFRHTDRDPIIRVFATQDRDFHYIHVRDNGIGIKPEDQIRVFGMLRKINGDQYEGAGIGLAICQRILRGVGGEMSVTSVYGNGSTFTVQWPRVVHFESMDMGKMPMS